MAYPSSWLRRDQKSGSHLNTWHIGLRGHLETLAPKRFDAVSDLSETVVSGQILRFAYRIVGVGSRLRAREQASEFGSNRRLLLRTPRSLPQGHGRLEAAGTGGKRGRDDER